MRHGGHSSSLVHVEADKARSPLARFAGVYSHADANVLSVRPFMRSQGSLHLDHRRHAIPRGLEDRKEAVSLGIDLFAFVRGES